MSGGFSMVTDSHCALDRDGEFAFWSVSRSSFRNADSEPERGTWKAHDGELHLSFRDGGVWTKAYLVDGDSMIWPRDGRYRVWERIKPNAQGLPQTAANQPSPIALSEAV